MPRQSKPYQRKNRGTWICTINGKRVTLGKTKKEAYQKFHELMADKKKVATESFTLYQLSQKYLTWVKQNRSEATYYRNFRYLKSLVEDVGRRLKPTNLTRAQVKKWTESQKTWGDTARADAIGVAQRLLNWAVEQSYLEHNPIRGLQKPTRRPRDIVYTDEQWRKIQEHATGPFLDVLDFLWSTGCRPKELRTLEARHIHDGIVLFPGDEAKGRKPRVIYLTDRSKAILDRHMRDDGPLFRNSKGFPWTKDAIVQRCQRISQKVAFRVLAYGARHSYATNSLIREVSTTI